MTNFEKLKQMINEMDEADVAEWADDNLPSHCDSLLRCKFCTEDFRKCDNKCWKHIRKWLKQEVNEDVEIH